jgi:hypothetical protein
MNILGTMYQGPGIAKELDAIPVQLPLHSAPLLMKKKIFKSQLFPWHFGYVSMHHGITL